MSDEAQTVERAWYETCLTVAQDLIQERRELKAEIECLKKRLAAVREERDSMIEPSTDERDKKLFDIVTICQNFNLNDVCNDCSPRDADHCNGCDAPLKELKERILNVITGVKA